MQFLLLVYIDESRLAELPPSAFDAEMKQCPQHADEMQARGRLLGFQHIEVRPVRDVAAVRSPVGA